MSQWTHIRGGLELVSSIHDYKPLKTERPDKDADDKLWDKYYKERFKSAYYACPEEQLKIGMPEPYEGDSSKPGLSFRVYEYSLPRAKKYIEEAFKLLPQGECGFRYSIKQDKYDGNSSSSDFDYKCQHDAFKIAVLNLYNDQYPYWTFKDLEKYFNIQVGWVEHINGIIIGIREDLRYCDGVELLEALEKFFEYLEQNSITIKDGYLEWQDEYKPNILFSWRNSRVGPEDHHCFYITKINTNEILYSKIYKQKRLPNGRRDWDAEGWNIIETGSIDKIYEKEDTTNE